ncbi:MAG: hypothetical protein FJW24_11290 [Acidimicrobiia bacterium]|nr:hypothetical protein [Acidimicrobiia bacterium]
MAIDIPLYSELKNRRWSFAEMLHAARAEADREGVHNAEAVAAEMNKVVCKERARHEQDHG